MVQNTRIILVYLSRMMHQYQVEKEQLMLPT
jgi:hypothetical protein